MPARNRTTVASSRQARNRANRNRDGMSSSLTTRVPGSAVWNITAGRQPAFNNTLRLDNVTHKFIQTVDLGVVMSTSTTVPTFFAQNFNFGQVAQVGSFAAVFDQYRIDELEVWIIPGLLATTTNQRETWYSVVDYDDATAPTQLSTFQQYSNALTTPCSQGHYFKFRPHIASAAYAGTFTGFMNVPSTWVDCASTTVQHYGVKMGFNSTSGSLGVQIVARFHMSFRNTI